MGILDFLFGNQNAKIQEYLKKGAIILDVRTDREFKSGAIKSESLHPSEKGHLPIICSEVSSGLS